MCRPPFSFVPHARIAQLLIDPAHYAGPGVIGLSFCSCRPSALLTAPQRTPSTPPNEPDAADSPT